MGYKKKIVKPYLTPLSNKIKRRKTGTPMSARSKEALEDMLDILSTVKANKGRSLTETLLEEKKKSKRKSRGFSGTATLSGKIKRGKKYSKRQKIGKKWTKYGIEKNGITMATEHRGDMATGVEGEAILVGHTSMPSKFCAINMWRALLKYCLWKMNCQIRDFGIRCRSMGFQNGDKFEFQYYGNATTDTLSFIAFEVDENSTFDSIAARFADNWDDRLDSFDDRIDSFNFFNNVGTTNYYQNCRLKISGLKVAVVTKSSLKLQNVTVENAADNEADDVTRVPLQGMLYECKGNNFRRKANNRTLPGFYAVANEHTLFEPQNKSVGNYYSGTSVSFYAESAGPGDNQQTTFYKTSEMPKPWEISNCKRARKFYIPAGGIRTSVLQTKFEMTLQAYFTLLYTYASTLNAARQYNEKQGLCNAIFLEKVIGRKNNTETGANLIRLWSETEFRQSTLIFGSESTFTLPITYQEEKV